MDYRRVVDFKYKGQLYSMFIDNLNRYYFLEIDKDGNFKYIDISLFLELGRVFTNPPRIARAMKDKNKKPMKILPKIIIGGVATVATLGSLLLVPATIEEINLKKAYSNSHQEYVSSLPYYNDQGVQTNISFAVEDSNEIFIVDTFTDLSIIDTMNIYDMSYLNKILDYDTVTLEDFYEVIDSNPNISDKFKPYVREFCKDLIEKQPDAERRVLYENLKTIDFHECENKFELTLACMSIDGLACYVRSENRIYVLKDYEYEKGTWNYQVLYHELSHAARTAMWERDGKKIRVQCEGEQFYTVTSAEALNSLFAISLFDYDEKDIAYQFQSNMFKIMVDSMDNYEISDYMNHSLGYFAHQLDEFHGDNNYATVLLKLIDTQFNDYHSDKIDIVQSEYYPIYEYLSDMYYKNKINSNTTYAEARSYTDRLLEELMFDVPEEYNVDINYFYQYLDEYLQTNFPNIEIGQTSIKK